MPRNQAQERRKPRPFPIEASSQPSCPGGSPRTLLGSPFNAPREPVRGRERRVIQPSGRRKDVVGRGCGMESSERWLRMGDHPLRRADSWLTGWRASRGSRPRGRSGRALEPFAAGPKKPFEPPRRVISDRSRATVGGSGGPDRTARVGRQAGPGSASRSRGHRGTYYTTDGRGASREIVLGARLTARGQAAFFSASS